MKQLPVDEVTNSSFLPPHHKLSTEAWLWAGLIHFYRFGLLLLRKVTKIVATKCQILRL